MLSLPLKQRNYETCVCLTLLRLTVRSSEEVIGCSREACGHSYMNLLICSSFMLFQQIWSQKDTVFEELLSVTHLFQSFPRCFDQFQSSKIHQVTQTSKDSPSIQRYETWALVALVVWLEVFPFRQPGAPSLKKAMQHEWSLHVIAIFTSKRSSQNSLNSSNIVISPISLWLKLSHPASRTTIETIWCLKMDHFPNPRYPTNGTQLMEIFIPIHTYDIL